MLSTPFSPPASTCFPTDFTSHKGLPVTAVPTQLFTLRSQLFSVLSNEQLKSSRGSFWCGLMALTACRWPYRTETTFSLAMSTILMEPSSLAVINLLSSSRKTSSLSNLKWGLSETTLSLLPAMLATYRSPLLLPAATKLPLLALASEVRKTSPNSNLFVLSFEARSKKLTRPRSPQVTMLSSRNYSFQFSMTAHSITDGSTE
jgi:hypothetical protein